MIVTVCLLLLYAVLSYVISREEAQERIRWPPRPLERPAPRRPRGHLRRRRAVRSGRARRPGPERGMATRGQSASRTEVGDLVVAALRPATGSASPARSARSTLAARPDRALPGHQRAAARPSPSRPAARSRRRGLARAAAAPHLADHPATGLTFDEARAFCAWASARAGGGRAAAHRARVGGRGPRRRRPPLAVGRHRSTPTAAPAPRARRGRPRPSTRTRPARRPAAPSSSRATSGSGWATRPTRTAGAGCAAAATSTTPGASAPAAPSPPTPPAPRHHRLSHRHRPGHRPEEVP